MRGLGIDLARVDRVAQLVHGSRGPRFISRVLCPAEAAACALLPRDAQPRFVASRWAAKEALFKACGGRRGQGLAFSGVEVKARPEMHPLVVLHSPPWRRATEGLVVWISLTHEHDVAAAVCVVTERG